MLDIGQPQINYTGVYKALVENNVDPTDCGKLQVRIEGIHSFDGNLCPVDSLPWAIPALPLAWSGGYNIYNKDHPIDGDPESNEVPRYNPHPPALLPNDTAPVANFSEVNKPELFVDQLANACGTGGHYTVPKRGNWVYVMFLYGDHMKPIYFSMAPSAKDWNMQKEFRSNRIQQKIDEITEFRDEFEPRDEKVGSDFADRAKIEVKVDKPKLELKPLDHSNGNTNRDVTCTTSANGTMIVIDNRNGKEQIYIIHKNYMEYTDDSGNRKIYVGRSRDTNPELVLDKDEPSNYEIGIEGNHELHILGNYDIYSKGRIHLQCDSHIQIDAHDSVGIVSRKGDIDVVLESGHINVGIENGDFNAFVKNHSNIHIGGDANIKVDGNMVGEIGKGCDVSVVDDLKIKAKNVNITTEEDILFNCNTFNITNNKMIISGEVDIGKSVKIGGTVDIKSSTTIGSQLRVGGSVDIAGTLINKGRAELGSPVIAYGLQVVNGSASGRGGSPVAPSSPKNATNPKTVERTTSPATSKNYNE